MAVFHISYISMKNSKQQAVIVSTSFPTLEQARVFAHQVIEERLAACCNIIPSVKSIYVWKGELSEDQECLVEMKTVESRYSKLEQLINEIHPYDLPMVLVTPISGSTTYIGWIKEQVL